MHENSRLYPEEYTFKRVLTAIFFRNSTNSVKVDTPKVIQNAPIAKVSNLVFKDKYFKEHHLMGVSHFYYREYALTPLI